MSKTLRHSILGMASCLALTSLPVHSTIAADLLSAGESDQQSLDQLSSDEFENRFADALSVTVSAGMIYAPRFLGDDDYELTAFPNISIEYGDFFFASLEGVGLNLINYNGFEAGVVVGYDPGRSESDSSLLSLSGDSNDDLVGLGDIDGSIEVGGFLGYTYENIEARIEVRQGIGGHEGMIGEATLSYSDQFNVGPVPLMWSVGAVATFADENYNSAFFDVNAAQSTASGLAEYDAGAGLVSYGLEGSLVLPVSERAAIIGFGSIEQLGSELADSSLVTERGSDLQMQVGLMMSYKLW